MKFRKDCRFRKIKEMKVDVCAGALIVKNKKWLFGKRAKNKSWAPGLWDIVGGHSLKHESPFDAMKRETLEETNLKVKKATLLATWKVKERDKNTCFLYYIYLVTAYKGKVKNYSKEHTKLRWLGRKKLSTKHLALDGYLSLIDNALIILKIRST